MFFFFLSLGHLNMLPRSIHFLANFMVLFTVVIGAAGLRLWQLAARMASLCLK